MASLARSSSAEKEERAFGAAGAQPEGCLSKKARRDCWKLARFGLSQVYAAQNKTAEAEKLLRTLADNPTSVVSKDQAQLSLARVLAKSNPAEAKKLLETLKAGPSAVSRAALSAQAEMK